MSLLREFPEINAIYDEHVADNEELLPHVFMGDVTRSIVALSLSPTRDDSYLKRFLDYLEQASVASDNDVTNLIAVSFIENLLGEERAIDIIGPLLGPTLMKDLLLASECICRKP